MTHPRLKATCGGSDVFPTSFLPYSALTVAEYFGPGSDHLWEDLDLDIIGLSTYFPLVVEPPTTVLSVAALEAGYARVFEEYLVPLVDRNPGRPLLFLEEGATGSITAPYHPAPVPARPFVFTDANGNGVDDGRETQANMFQALFNTMARYPRVLNGVFFWENWMGTDAMWARWVATFRGYSLRDKPAEAVVQRVYQGFANQ